MPCSSILLARNHGVIFILMAYMSMYPALIPQAVDIGTVQFLNALQDLMAVRPYQPVELTSIIVELSMPSCVNRFEGCEITVSCTIAAHGEGFWEA